MPQTLPRHNNNSLHIILTSNTLLDLTLMTTASPLLPDETSYPDAVTPLGSSAPYHDNPITDDVSSRTSSTHVKSHKLDFLRAVTEAGQTQTESTIDTEP